MIGSIYELFIWNFHYSSIQIDDFVSWNQNFWKFNIFYVIDES